MPKFNKRSAATVVSRTARMHPDVTTNHEGGVAFKLTPEMRLYQRACTSMVGEPKFYESAESHDMALVKDIHAVAKLNPEWVLKLASYCRNEMYLRSLPILILGEACKIPQCRPFVRDWAPKILRRPDELKEVLAYVRQESNTIPRCLRKGVREAFHTFDEYQLEKYDSRREPGTFTLQDVIRLTKPRPINASQEAMMQYLVKGELPKRADVLLPKLSAKKAFDKLDKWGPQAKSLIKDGHVTWEVAISKFGGSKAVWETLDLPFMAALRNLRNMLKARADMAPVIALLTYREAVKRSKQLPFRFWSAYREIDGFNDCDAFEKKAVLAAINQALEYSVDNIPALPGRTAILVDVSASMTSNKISKRSSVSCADIACTFGSACGKRMDGIVAAFGDSFKWVDVDGLSVIKGAQAIAHAGVGHATYTHKPVMDLVKKGTKVDRIIVLTDEECYANRGSSPWFDSRQFVDAVAQYRRSVNKDVKVITINLNGYGTASLPQDDPNVAMLAGWSERVFTFISMFEEGLLNSFTLVRDYEGPQVRFPRWAVNTVPDGARDTEFLRRYVPQEWWPKVTKAAKAIAISDAAKAKTVTGLFTISQVAEALEVKETTVRKWITVGDLTGVKRNGDRYVSRTALRKFAKTRSKYADCVVRLVE